MNRDSEKIIPQRVQFLLSRELPVNRKNLWQVKNPLIFFDCDLRTKNFSEKSAQTGSSSPVDSEGVEFFGRK